MAALSIQLPFPVFTDADGQPVEFSGAASGASTDWYVVRRTETGAEIPPDILAARQAARDAIVRG